MIWPVLSKIEELFKCADNFFLWNKQCILNPLKNSPEYTRVGAYVDMYLHSFLTECGVFIFLYTHLSATASSRIYALSIPWNIYLLR